MQAVGEYAEALKASVELNDGRASRTPVELSFVFDGDTGEFVLSFYLSRASDAYLLHVMLGGHPLGNSPYPCRVRADRPSAEGCRLAPIAEPIGATAEEATFVAGEHGGICRAMLHICDRFGESQVSHVSHVSQASQASQVSQVSHPFCPFARPDCSLNVPILDRRREFLSLTTPFPYPPRLAPPLAPPLAPLLPPP